MSTIRRGSKGDEVVRLQKILISRGYNLDPYGADGDFGGGTHRAVCSWQASIGLDVDGIVGPDTWATLESNNDAAYQDGTGAAEVEKWQTKIRERCTDPQRLRVCDEALFDLGVTEEPRGSNRGQHLDATLQPFGESYVEHHRINANSVPWCMVWVSCVLARALKASSWKDLPWRAWYGAASQIGQWGKDKGVYVQGHEMPMAGDILVMTRDGSGSDVGGGTSAGHVGIVLWADEVHDWSIDGNVSDSIQIKMRKRSQVDYVSWPDA